MPEVVEDGATDAALLDAVRSGDLGASDELFRRHAEPARRAAARWSSDPADREDLLAEAFVRVLIAVRTGTGPRDSLRPYLLVTMRNLAIGWGRRRARLDLYGDLPEQHGAPVEAGADEVAVRRWNAGLAWAAFCSLPDRWRTLLWHTEIEGATPAELARLLGLSPNGVAAMAVRAREGLRRAYLQVQVPDADEPACREVRRHMGAWVRDGVSARRAGKVARHVTDCMPCQAVTAGLREFNRELRPVTSRSERTASVVAATSAGAAKSAALPGVLSTVAAGGKVAAVAAAAAVAVVAIPGAPPGHPVPEPRAASPVQPAPVQAQVPVRPAAVVAPVRVPSPPARVEQAKPHDQGVHRATNPARNVRVPPGLLRGVLKAPKAPVRGHSDVKVSRRTPVNVPPSAHGRPLRSFGL
jgi:RNA polymerase sigma factor (sigma-70 family)